MRAWNPIAIYLLGAAVLAALGAFIVRWPILATLGIGWWALPIWLIVAMAAWMTWALATKDSDPPWSGGR